MLKRLRWKLAELAASGTLIAIFAVVYYLLYPRLLSWHPHVAAVIGILVLCVCIYFAWLGLILLFSLRLRLSAMRLLLPFILTWGIILRLTREEVRSNVVELNNRIVIASWSGRTPKRTLILLPHCLQNYDCLVKITNDINMCRDCGKCVLPQIRDLAKKYDIKASVVTGGTEARRQMREYGAELIIACACERDLLAGILDAYPTPVWGIMNSRPFGPCRNTTMEIADLEEIMKICKYPEKKL